MNGRFDITVIAKVRNALLCGGIALSLCIGSIAYPTTALAEGLEASGIANLQQMEIEALESAYESALNRVADAKARIAENQAKIDKLERELPGQQERTDEAIREMYVMQRSKLRYLDSLLGAESFDEFIKRVDYFERVGEVNLDELNKLKTMLAELEEARVALDAAQQEADTQAEIAREALQTVQNERAEKQRKAQEESIAQDNSSVILDGADWHMSEAEFIEAWAPRIDAYLAGSPMEGTGAIFARQAFRYCIDPRWSPAISNTESSKGRYCIRPFNAWGWGAADSDPYNLASEWSSWEEAIETHIRGLANGYGYTISKSAAEKYCSTPDSWYSNTLREMSAI